jgi:hypothetical protein
MELAFTTCNIDVGKARNINIIKDPKFPRGDTFESCRKPLITVIGSVNAADPAAGYEISSKRVETMTYKSAGGDE